MERTKRAFQLTPRIKLLLAIGLALLVAAIAVPTDLSGLGFSSSTSP